MSSIGTLSGEVSQLSHCGMLAEYDKRELKAYPSAYLSVNIFKIRVITRKDIQPRQ